MHNVKIMRKKQNERYSEKKLRDKMDIEFHGKMIDVGWFSNTEESFKLILNVFNGEVIIEGGIESKISKRSFDLKEVS